MAIPKPITRVEQYLAHISGMRVNVPEAPLTREERYLAAWAKKSGIEDAEIQGDPPLTLKDCIGEPFKGLVLYGKSTQVTTTGAQLLTSAVIKGENCGVTLTKKDSVWHLEGTNTADGVRNIRLTEPTEHFKLPAGTYTLSFSKDGVFPIKTNISISKVANPDISSEQIWTGIGNAGLNTPTKFILDGTEEALSIFVNFPAGEPISCDLYVMLNAGDSALPWEPYTGGKPSPSPDYPQEIQSTKSEVVVHGKNLIPVDYSESKISYDKKTEQWKFDAMPTKANVRIVNPNKITWTLPRGLYTMTMCDEENVNIIGLSDATEKEWVALANVNYTKKQSTFSINKEFAKLGIYLLPIDTSKPGRVQLQLEHSSESTDYEPYHEPQSLTFASPTSLPGIPVFSRGNYTDDTGQQWICDEVDLERGVYVQRINELAFDQLPFSYEKTPVNHNDTFIASIDEQLSGTETGHAMCQYAFFDGVSYELAMQEDCRCYVWRNNVTIQFRDSVGVNTLETFAEWLSSHPNASISYVLATPIETPLSEADIAAYRALTTYKGTTILESECYLKVKYSKLRK